MLVASFLHFNRASTVCSTIPSYNSAFSNVLDDSYVHCRIYHRIPPDLPEDTKECPIFSVRNTTSVPTLFYQSPQDWPGLTRATLVKYVQVTQ